MAISLLAINDEAESVAIPVTPVGQEQACRSRHIWGVIQAKFRSRLANGLSSFLSGYTLSRGKSNDVSYHIGTRIILP